MASLFWIVLIGGHASMHAAEPDVPVHIDVKGVDAVRPQIEVLFCATFHLMLDEPSHDIGIAFASDLATLRSCRERDTCPGLPSPE